jgi:glycosyltransferase involved in cell wall biosynthesis
MHDPLFTVIVPTYNRPTFLLDALDSVRRQTIEDFECIVVDDASAEPIGVPNDPRFRLVRRPTNGGLAAARNTGIEHARGRYVAFLDDDDVYTPNRLALALEGLGRARVSICWRGNVGDDRPIRNRTLEGNVHDVILEAEVPQMGQTTVERTAVPRFDERFEAAEDADWWLRLSARESVTSVRRVGLLFRRHDGPRHRNDRVARLCYRRLLVEAYRDYFASRPRAAAYQWKRIGLLAHDLGDAATARAAFARSLRLRPTARGVWHLARSVRGVPPDSAVADTEPNLLAAASGRPPGRGNEPAGSGELEDRRG